MIPFDLLLPLSLCNMVTPLQVATLLDTKLLSRDLNLVSPPRKTLNLKSVSKINS